MFGNAVTNKKPADTAGAAPARGTKKVARAKQRRFCNVCGKPSGSTICAKCADRIRAEALARKKREDKGEE